MLISVHLETDLCNICLKCKWKIPVYNYGLCRAVFKSSSLTGTKRNETNFIDNVMDIFCFLATSLKQKSVITVYSVD